MNCPSANIYCIGRNYAEHARELGNALPEEPVVFLKSSAALRPLAGGPLAFEEESMHHEAEIVLRIGRNVPLGQSQAWDDVDALALGLDMTRREVQNKLKEKGLPWTTAKSFAGSALVGDFVAKSAFKNLDHIEFSFSINGVLKQQGDSRNMLFNVKQILVHLSRYHELYAGDLVYTGTPAGVGPMRRGDAFELSFTQLGKTYEGKL